MDEPKIENGIIVKRINSGWDDETFESTVQKEITALEKQGLDYYDIKITSNGKGALLLFKPKVEVPTGSEEIQDNLKMTWRPDKKTGKFSATGFDVSIHGPMDSKENIEKMWKLHAIAKAEGDTLSNLM